MLDAELVSLGLSKGLLSSGPIDQSDRRSIQEFDFKDVKKQLMQTTPHLSSLMFTVGQIPEEDDSQRHTQSFCSLCASKKGQQPDQWFLNSCGFDADCRSYQ